MTGIFNPAIFNNSIFNTGNAPALPPVSVFDAISKCFTFIVKEIRMGSFVINESKVGTFVSKNV